MSIEPLRDPRAQLPPDRPLFVYGIGASGRLCRTVFDGVFRRPVTGFIDSTRDGTVDGMEVLALDRFLAGCRAGEPRDPVVVVCSQAVEEIHAGLRGRGFTGTVLDGQAYLMETMGHLFDPDVGIVLHHHVHPRDVDRTMLPGISDILGRGHDRYRETLRALSSHIDGFRRIESRTADPLAPRWINGWLPALDGMAIYAMLAERRPRWYVEIGSGNSTMFARRAIADGGLPTRIRSIDPFPRADIDELCDEVLRLPFESVSERAFDGVDEGDVVFIDSSHRVFQGSDVTVFFTETLQTLPRGVLIGVHDVFLPFDYPVKWQRRLYSEQYLLACWLLAGAERFDIVLPSQHVLRHPEFRHDLSALFDGSGVPPDERQGGSFWFSLRREPEND